MNYPDSVRYLYSLGNEVKSIKLGLERIGALLAELGHPERAARVVHVAGTNGKGSTCTMIESGLRQAGLSTGLYTSPHLVTPVERIKINGKPVSEAEFTSAFDEMHAVAEAMVRHGTLDMHPTYFESLTAMAFLLFRQARVNTMVIEVGLGGRLDASNLVQPAVTVITPVDFDHMEHLGDTIEKIAGEKAGIIKPGVPVVVARQRPEALAVIEEQAAKLGAPVDRVEDWRIDVERLDAYGSVFQLARGDKRYEIACPLAGAHQVNNAATAAVALSHLGLDAKQIEQGIAAARWPGRLEHVRSEPDVFLDGAHNVAGATALADYIRRFHQGRRVWMIFGVMRDKQVSTIAELLFPLAHELVLTTPDQSRSLPAEEIAKFPAAAHGRVIDKVNVALGTVLAEAAPEDVVFLTGSLYLVGEARPYLVKDEDVR